VSSKKESKKIRTRSKSRKDEKRRTASSHGASERSNHDSTVDPHRNFLVDAHELVVRIGLGSSSVGFESLKDRSPVPEETRRMSGATRGDERRSED